MNFRDREQASQQPGQAIKLLFIWLEFDCDFHCSVP